MIEKAQVLIDLDGSVWLLWRDHTHRRSWEFSSLKLTDAAGNMLHSEPWRQDGT